MSAAGFEIEATEYRADHIKADALAWATLDSFGKSVRLLMEAKDYGSVLTKEECHKFINEYKPHIESKKYEEAWLISKGPIAPDARALVDAQLGLRAMDFPTLQRRLFNIDQLIEGAVSEYKQEGISAWYVDPHLVDGSNLQERVDKWLDEEGALPLAVIGPYGTGKSTYSLYLAARMAENAKVDSTRRVPIRVPLAEVYDEQSMDGLFGKLLASKSRIRNYHFNLFRELNAAGRFVLIFDGFDEMKHGMTIETFERNVNRLLTLDEADSKIIVLGRDTAFHDDHEFRAVIGGVQRTASGQAVRAEGRRPFEQLHLRDFTVDEAHDFVRRFFPAQLQKLRDDADVVWVKRRIDELIAGTFDEVLRRPVHARMLCQVATNKDADLSKLTKFGLYDLFVHHLIDREARKEARYAGFNRDCRRHFNAAIAWWLWEQGGASTTTLADIPDRLVKEATKNIPHEFPDAELRRELTAGLLVEKREGGVIFFSHRSIQEFLVSEYLIQTDLLQGVGLSSIDPRKVLPLMSEVVIDFLVQRLNQDNAREIRQRWLQFLSRLVGPDVDPSWLEIFRLIGAGHPESISYLPIKWAPVVKFFIQNGANSFKMPVAHTKEIQEILDRVREGSSIEHTAAVFMLVARLAQESARPPNLMANLVAQCLAADSIKKAESDLNGKGRNHRYQVMRDEDLPFWNFQRSMESVRRDSGEWIIQINFRQLESDMAEILGYSFTRPGAAITASVVPASAVLNEIERLERSENAWDTKAAKRYIEDRDMRSKISPLLVVEKESHQRPQLRGGGRR